MNWWDWCHDLHFLSVEFQVSFSLSSFTFINRLFNSSSPSAIRIVSSVYLKLLIFLLAIMISDCASSSLTFHMMYSAYKLNKQGDNIQPWCIPSPIWNQSIFLYLVLTVASWSVFRFLRKRWSGLVFPSLEEFSTVCCDAHSQRLCVANKAEVDVFSGTLLLFWSSNGCWQFDLRFLCLF